MAYAYPKMKCKNCGGKVWDKDMVPFCSEGCREQYGHGRSSLSHSGLGHKFGFGGG